MTAPKAALVTGSAQRIGRTIALDLAARGFRVGLHCNKSTDAAEALKVDIEAAGGTACVLPADLADEAATNALVAQTTEALNAPLTLLINNASTFDHDTVETATRESWDWHMEANLRAPFVLSQKMAAALPGDQDGLIVNMIDQRVWKLTPAFMTYTLSKSGLWTLTQTMAQALAPRIRVNAIGPGPTLRNPRQSEEHFAKQMEGVPLKRGAALDEITDAIGFMLSARSMTGQMIALDGGQHLGWETPDVVGVVE
ncbi:MAG: SDR family oxidoreductase [Alphaproteobacteria bacterium]